MNDTRIKDYRSLVNRILYDSPLYTWWGKLSYGVILLITLYLAGTVWIDWLTPLSNGWLILFAMTVAFFGSWLGIAYLLYLDRRDPEPWWFFVGTLAVALFVTTAPAAYINGISPFPTLTVGFNEEFWKALPLLILVFFAPTLVSGTRDGLIYDALGGFGFNITEIANYFLKAAYPAEGIAGLSGQLAISWWLIGVVKLCDCVLFCNAKAENISHPNRIVLTVYAAKDDGEHRPGHG